MKDFHFRNNRIAEEISSWNTLLNFPTIYLQDNEPRWKKHFRDISFILCAISVSVTDFLVPQYSFLLYLYFRYDYFNTVARVWVKWCVWWNNCFLFVLYYGRAVLTCKNIVRSRLSTVTILLFEVANASLRIRTTRGLLRTYLGAAHRNGHFVIYMPGNNNKLGFASCSVNLLM